MIYISKDCEKIEKYEGARIRFNPFKRLSCKYGAPMGRHGDMLQNAPSDQPLYIKHCGGDGFYDKGGAYWGYNKVYAIFTKKGDFCAYVENVPEALKEIKEII